MRYFGLFDGKGKPVGLVRVSPALVSEQLDRDGVWRTYVSGPDAYESVELAPNEAATVGLILGIPDALTFDTVAA